MKPRELYSGSAPAAQAQMGAGILEAGANIGRSIQSGYESIGKSIGAGLQAVGGAVGKYQTVKNANNITRSLLSDDNLSEPILGVKGEAREKMLASFDNVVKQHGQMGAAQFSTSVLSPLHEYYNIGRQYTQQMDIAKQNAKNPFYAAAAGGLMSSMNQDSGLPQRSLGVGGGVGVPLQPDLTLPVGDEQSYNTRLGQGKKRSSLMPFDTEIF